MRCAFVKVKMTVNPRLLVLLPLLAVGCAVNQEKEVARYRSVLNQDAPSVTVLPGQPLSLEQVLALANQNNERLGLAGEVYLQALIARQQAASSFLPTISLAPSYAIQEKSGSNNSNSHATDVPVTGGINLFNGFSDLANYRAAGRTIEQRRALLLDAQATVLLGVAQTYYQILRSERSVEVLTQSLAVQDERVRDIRARQAAGLARRLDVAQTSAQAAGTRVSLISAQNDVQSGRTTLEFLIGIAVLGTPLVDEAAVPPSMPPLAQLMQDAMAGRQDLLAASAAIAAARAEVDAAIGRYYPSVTLNVEYFLSRESNPSDSLWNAFLMANLPIFSGGTIEAGVRQAWSQFRQTKMLESQTRKQVRQDVQTSYDNLAASRARLVELQIQVAAAEEALRQAEQSYQNGLATNLDRLTAQNILQSAQLDLVSERYNQKVFYLNLLRAMGHLSTRLPGETANGPTSMPAALPATVPATVPLIVPQTMPGQP